MFDLMYNEQITVQRRTAITGRAAETWEDVPDAATIRCRLERVRRRTLDQDGTEILGDATMMYRKTDAPGLKAEDRIKTSEGTIYKIIGITEQQLLFSKLTYARADLAFSRDE